MSVWRQVNPNPRGRSVGDCAVRAVAIALEMGWYEAYDILCAEGRRQGDLPSSDAVWGAVLRDHGFKRSAIPNSCPDCYTARDFCRDHSQGVYVLALGGHVATVVNGQILDSWNSADEVPIYFYRQKRYGVL